MEDTTTVAVAEDQPTFPLDSKVVQAEEGEDEVVDMEGRVAER